MKKRKLERITGATIDQVRTGYKAFMARHGLPTDPYATRARRQKRARDRAKKEENED